jgi:hypothetical protein
MNLRHLMVGLLACAALQACTSTPPPPPPRPAAPPAPVVRPEPPSAAIATPVPDVSVQAVTPATGTTPAVAEAPSNAAIDLRSVCDGADEGSRLQVRAAGGETLNGVCVRGANGWLKFAPNGGR